MPFIELINASDNGIDALDIGCGRGEWLEVLREVGLKARGVDLDEGMLAGCRLQDLDVLHGNALDVLKEMPDQSLSIVSAFHVVEHITFEEVRLLIRQALRVLKPGGLLILETPNPENIVVATSLFYLDPSHVRPLPAELLSFAVEYEGFSRNTIVRLQEPAGIDSAIKLDLIQVLNAVSPDYAVVSQKEGEAHLLEQFDSAFQKSYGITLNALAQRYQAQENQQHDQLVDQTNRWISYCENRLSQADERYEFLHNRNLLLERRIERLEAIFMQFGAIKSILKRALSKFKGLFRRALALLKRIPFLYKGGVYVSKKLGLHPFLQRLARPGSTSLSTRLVNESAQPSARVEHIHAQLKKAHKGKQEDA